LEGYPVATVKLWTDEGVGTDPAVKAVFDDIRATRESDFDLKKLQVRRENLDADDADMQRLAAVDDN
jgi:hypothetical protein